ncbi:MAG: zinc-dependent metalloprotease [Acidobacteriaceae bacterium]|nr:zinc-dependent metalloprotease [Acidobacteriaceae bacterium]
MAKPIVLALLFFSSLFAGQKPASPEPQSFASRIAGLQKIDGYMPLYWDAHTGKMWLEIASFDREFLYITALSAGVGSNELGLDRGSMNPAVVVEFQRSGPKVLLIESNYRFRATANDPAERRAERDSFARSTLWGFEVAAEENGRVLVDATNFFLRDAARVSERIARQKQGTYRVDATRTAFYLPLTKGFPRNTEVETTLTLTGEPTGALVREVTPSPEAITVREHQSFVALPEPGYQPRLQDPRAGYFATEFMDFSAPVDKPVMTRYIARRRLEKKDPSAAISDPVQPIVYYVDPGAPRPIRQALIEGASWWNQAFEAAGFHNGFQVKVLPTDADPMDVRYNIIQWVHRSTRGWSYGNSIVDPRTGEIIKGVVSLGSLREHQDYLIFEGLMAPHVPGHDTTKLLTDAVYARLRQLAAHEVGHTLGLQHNYIASTRDRASVMDYPGPWIGLDSDNNFDLSHAYAVGIGAWDKVSINWGYRQFSPGTNEDQQLDKIITDAAAHGLTFITDADSRPPGSAHPQSHLWDNGPNAVDELERLLKIRSIALDRFGENNIELGAPMATLDEVLVPLYFLHRYQTEAASKVLGGNQYTYALRGDGQQVTKIVPAAEQRRALKALLDTISPANLTISERILNLIPPRPPAYPRTEETFPSRTGLTFDPLAGAEAASNLTVGLMLNPQRAARLVEYHARQNDNPGLEEVVDTLLAATWEKPVPPGLDGQVARRVNSVVLIHLIGLALDGSAPPAVRSVALSAIEKIKGSADPYSLHLIETFEKTPDQLELPKPLEPPPGQPIGEDGPSFIN